MLEEWGKKKWKKFMEIKENSRIQIVEYSNHLKLANFWKQTETDEKH